MLMADKTGDLSGQFKFVPADIETNTLSVTELFCDFELTADK